MNKITNGLELQGKSFKANAEDLGVCKGDSERGSVPAVLDSEILEEFCGDNLSRQAKVCMARTFAPSRLVVHTPTRNSDQ